MDDKKFEDLLNKYAKAERGDPDKDLCKYYGNCEVNCDGVAAKKTDARKRKMIILACFLLVVFICLAILLPLLLRKKSEFQEPIIIFNDITLTEINSMAEYNHLYGTQISSFNIDFKSSLYLSMTETDNPENHIGLKFTFGVYGVNVESVYGYAQIKNKRVGNLPTEFQAIAYYKDYKINYLEIANSELSAINYYIQFTAKDVTYLMQINCYEKTDVQTVLEEIL